MTTEPVTSTELNGLHPERLEDVIESLKDDNNLKAFSGPWRSRVTWEGGFRAKAHTRTHTVEFDEPEGLDTKDTAASAHEHLLSAVGACLTVGFILNATRQGIRVRNLEVALEGNFENILKWADLDEGNPGYGGIKAKLFVAADADEDVLRELWKKAVDGSPVTQTVIRPTKVEADFEAI
ncbi:MAG TPA: OsmC family protein [Acidimicrobiales bacterium]|nr:OsmC family protein [Acidimicrobiales bacterium]